MLLLDCIKKQLKRHKIVCKNAMLRICKQQKEVCLCLLIALAN